MITEKSISLKNRKEIPVLADNTSLAKFKVFTETNHKKIPKQIKEGAIKDIYYHLSADAPYDPSREKERRPGNLCDYREFIKKNKRKKNGK